MVTQDTTRTTGTGTTETATRTETDQPPATAGAWDYSAHAQMPSLAAIDAAIMRAVVAGDIEHRDALMATRAAVALAEILGTLPAAEAEADSAAGAAEEDAHDDA